MQINTVSTVLSQTQCDHILGFPGHLTATLDIPQYIYIMHIIILSCVCNIIMCVLSEFSLEFCEDEGVGMMWEELLPTSKLPYSTYLKIKEICSLKARKFKCSKYTGENTAV